MWINFLTISLSLLGLLIGYGISVAINLLTSENSARTKYGFITLLALIPISGACLVVTFFMQNKPMENQKEVIISLLPAFGPPNPKLIQTQNIEIRNCAGKYTLSPTHQISQKIKRNLTFDSDSEIDNVGNVAISGVSISGIGSINISQFVSSTLHFEYGSEKEYTQATILLLPEEKPEYEFGKKLEIQVASTANIAEGRLLLSSGNLMVMRSFEFIQDVTFSGTLITKPCRNFDF